MLLGDVFNNFMSDVINLESVTLIYKGRICFLQ